MTLRTKRLLGYGAALAVLAAVFVFYLRPQMMVAVGDLVWACFQ